MLDSLKVGELIVILQVFRWIRIRLRAYGQFWSWAPEYRGWEGDLPGTSAFQI